MSSPRHLSSGDLLTSREFRCLLVFGAMAAAAFSVAPSISLALSTRVGFSAATYGLLLTLASVGAMASGLKSSMICARFGRRRVMQCGVWLFSASWAATFAAPSWASLCLCVLAGGSASILFGLLFSHIGTNIQKSDRPRSYSWMLAATGVGYTVGPLLAPLMLELTAAAFASWAIVSGGVLHAWLNIMVPEFRPQASKVDASRRRHGAWLMPQAAVPAFCVLMIMKAGNILVGSYGPLHAQRLYSTDTWASSIAYSLLGATMVLAPFLLSLLKKLLPENTVATMTYAGMAIGLISCGLAATPAVFIAAFALWAVCWDLAYPFASAALSDAVNESEQVAMSSTLQWTSSAASLFLTPASGAAVSIAGAPLVFLTMGAGTIAVLLFVNQAVQKQHRARPA